MPMPSSKPPAKSPFSSPDWSQALPKAATDWEPLFNAVALRFNREYQGQAVALPEEVEAMSLFREWTAGTLQSRLASPFWDLLTPQKNQHALDLGCGLSFLIYPWRDWEVCFHGQDISTVARDALQSRGPQLNSKLFKGVKLAPAHQLDYAPASFDWAVATGISCYYSPAYWQLVLQSVQKVLKPGSPFVFDVLDPAAELAENWAILEMYLGTEVCLEPLGAWEDVVKAAGGKIVGDRPGELFKLYKVQF